MISSRTVREGLCILLLLLLSQARALFLDLPQDLSSHLGKDPHGQEDLRRHIQEHSSTYVAGHADKAHKDTHHTHHRSQDVISASADSHISPRRLEHPAG